MWKNMVACLETLRTSVLGFGGGVRWETKLQTSVGMNYRVSCMSSLKGWVPSMVIERQLRIFHSQSDMCQVTVLAKRGTWGRGRAGLGERWDIWSWRCWKNIQGQVSSSWKCREEVGLTDLCDKEVLVEATEVNEMTQTKTVERREEP